MLTKFGLTTALFAVLALGVNGQRGGGDNNGPGCCYGADAKCQRMNSETTCQRMSSRKGCEWRSGEDADCTVESSVDEPVESGCCYSAEGNSKCDVDDITSCQQKASRMGCEWRVGDTEDLCATPTSEPGCCTADQDSKMYAKCLAIDAQDSCEAKTSRWDCEWRSGANACDPTEPPVVDAHTVDCSGRWECRRDTITCPSDEPCIVLCTGDSGCMDATINCPADYACDVQCVDNNSCNDAVITWPTDPGMGTLTCSGQYACNNIDFPEPEPTTAMDFECLDFRQCEDSTIRCPVDADCSLTCEDQLSCRDTTLICPDDHACDVTCGPNVDIYGPCINMDIQWPSTPGLGSLTCADGVGSQMDSGSCYDVNSPPTSAQEHMAFGVLSSPLAAQPALLNESQMLLLLLAGACAVLMTLATAFYLYGRKNKVVAASWDIEE